MGSRDGGSGAVARGGGSSVCGWCSEPGEQALRRLGIYPQAAEKKLVGLCYDKQTGKEKWRVTISEGDEVQWDDKSNLASPSAATDGDRVFLNGPLLVVERERAGRVERTEFRRAGVRIEPASSDGSLIAVSGDGRQVMIGQFVRAEQRVQLARDMRRAVREDRTAFEGQSGVREADTRI